MFFSDETRHFLQIYYKGELVADWAVGTAALTNIQKRRPCSLEKALYRAYRPRFVQARYKSTSAVTSKEHLYDAEMLQEIFYRSNLTNGDLTYSYFVF